MVCREVSFDEFRNRNIQIVLAPLQGVTTAIFRSVFMSKFGGCRWAVAPFLTTRRGAAPLIPRDLRPESNPTGLVLVPQLLGNDGDDFARAGAALHDAMGCDEINWNLGCPSGTVTARKQGAGFLPDPQGIDRFLDRVCRRLPCALSIKMRLGMHRDREWEALVPILNRYPIRSVTLHGRIGAQGYRGQANLDLFAEFRAALRRPVIHSGDVTSVIEARRVLAKCPDLPGFMLGRGLIANPLLAVSILEGTERSPSEVRAAIWEFHDQLLAAYQRESQEGAVVERMKALFVYWGPKILPDRSEVEAGRGSEDRLVRRTLRATTLGAYLDGVAVIRQSGRRADARIAPWRSEI